MELLSRLPHRAVAAAATLTGKRFSLLVASSLVATSGIVAVAMTGNGGDPALAALLGQELPPTTAATTPAGASSPAGSTSPSAPSAGGAASQVTGPLASPTPLSQPAASGPVSDTNTTGAPTTPGTTAPTGPVGPIKHVFVIALSSPGYEQSFGAASQMPYLATTLRPQGQLVPGYSLLTGATLPNNIAMVSGQRPNPLTEANCTTYKEFPPGTKLDKKGRVSGSGCAYPVEALTVADQIGSARLRWRAYMEGMADETGPHNCVYPQPNGLDEPPVGGYAARNNPFVYFHSLLDLGDCATNDVPLDQLTTDLRKLETTPDFAFVSPNLCRAGMDGQCPEGEPEGGAAADLFLAEWAPKILASKAFKKGGLLVIAFNGLNSPEQAAGSNPLRMGSLLVSRYVTRGGTREGEFNPYSLLRTIEDLFGLAPLAEAGSTQTKSFGADLLGPQF